MIEKKKLLNILLLAFLFTLTTTILYLVSLENYLIFHSLAEIFSAIIGGAIFLVIWNAISYVEDNFLIVIATGIVFVVVMDLIHMLAYKGMNIIGNPTPNHATQLWIAARYMQSLLFLTAVVLLNRNFKKWVLLVIISFINMCVYASIFYFNNFPTCYLEGQGLTAFKIISEYIIIAIILITIGILYLQRSHFVPKMYRMLQAFFILSILSEFSFTMYLSVFGFMNFLGHIFKIYAFYHLYSAFVSEVYIQPYQRAEKLSYQNAQRLNVVLTGSNISIFSRDMNHVCTWAFNPPFEMSPKDFIGKKLEDVLQPEDAEKMNAICEHVNKIGKNIYRQKIDLSHNDEKRWFEISTEPIKDHHDIVIGSNCSLIDITNHVTMENELQAHAKKLDDNMREIQCLFSIMKSSRQQYQQDPEKILNEIVDLISQGFPEDRTISVRLTIDDISCITGKIKNSKFKQEIPIKINDRVRGNIQVNCSSCSYDDHSPEQQKNMLDLLDAIADEIGLFIERNEAQTRLLESEERYRQIFNGVGEGIELLTLDGTIIDVNNRSCEIFGYDRGELIGRHYSDLVAQGSDLIDGKNLLERPGNRIKFEQTALRKNGEEFSTEISLQRFAIGGQNYNIALIQDISARKQAEMALKQSRQRYERIFNGVMDGILLETIDGTIIDANESICQLYGLPCRELIGRKINEFIAEGSEFHDFAEPRLDQKGKPTPYESFHKNIYGKNIPVEITGHRYSIDNQEYIIAVVRDISERKAAEKVSDESSERYKRIFNGAQDAIILQDYEGRIFDVNNRACEMYGYDRNTFLSKSIREIISENQPIIIFPETERGDYSKAELYKTIHVRANGSTFPVELSGQKFIFGDDKYLITVIRDITERKKSEEAIKNSLNRLTTLHNIERTINTTIDMDLSLSLILEEVHRALNMDACNLLLFNKELNILEYKKQIGFYSDALRSTSLRIGQGLAGKTALEREPVLIPTLSNEGISNFLKNLKIKEGFNAYFAFPLLAKGKLIGVIEILNREVFFPDTDWINFAGILSEQIANAIDSGLMFQNVTQTNFQLRTAYDLTLKKFAVMLTRQNINDENHVDNVALKTVELAERLNVSGEQLNKIYRGAILHDIGEAAIPNTMMTKTKTFSDREKEIIRKHPLFAAEILSDVPYLKQVMDIPLYHHERWDGSGYPYGLSGELIPLPARIFAVVDVWDALCSDRPWRKAWPKAEAIDYIKSNHGTLFDPMVVDAFLKMVN